MENLSGMLRIQLMKNLNMYPISVPSNTSRRIYRKCSEKFQRGKIFRKRESNSIGEFGPQINFTK